MADNGLVQVRIDRKIRDKASEVFGRYGLTVSEAVRILLTRTANEGAMPHSLFPEDIEYDAWFRAKVQEAIDSPHPRIAGEDVEHEMAELRAELSARRDAAE
jgi:DNA-damage-inducible protein J